MKLELFRKNYKNKRILIVSILGLGIVIGGISLYRSYALYEEEKEYNVLKGQIPDFGYDVKFAVTVDGEKSSLPTDKNYVVNVTCNNEIKAEFDYESWSPIISNIKEATKCNLDYQSINKFETLKNKLKITSNSMDDLIKNDIDTLVNNKEAMIYLTKSPELIKQLKESNNYKDEIKEKILKSTVITEKEKYEAGLPCYLLKNYKEEDFYSELEILLVNSGTIPNEIITNKGRDEPNHFLVAYSDTSVIIGSETKIDLANYSEVKIEFNHYTDYKDDSLTGTFDFGIGNGWSDFSCTQNKTFNNGNNSPQSSSLTLDVSNYNDSYYIKAKLHHGTESKYNTIHVKINNIALLN